MSSCGAWMRKEASSGIHGMGGDVGVNGPCGNRLEQSMGQI